MSPRSPYSTLRKTRPVSAGSAPRIRDRVTPEGATAASTAEETRRLSQRNAERAARDTASLNAISRDYRRGVSEDAANLQLKSAAELISQRAADVARTKRFISSVRARGARVDKQLEELEAKGANLGVSGIGNRRSYVMTVEKESPVPTEATVDTPGARERYRAFLSDQRIADVRANAAAVVEATEAECSAQLLVSDAARVSAERTAASALTQVSESERQVAALRAANDALHERVRYLQHQVIDRERDLVFFGDLVPALQSLRARFQFTSVTELVQRLEVLEQQQVAVTSELVEVQRQRDEEKAENKQSKAKFEADLRGELNALRSALASVTTEKEQLEESISQTRGLKNRAESLYERLLDLSSAVMSLHDRWVCVPKEGKKADEQTELADGSRDPVLLLRELDAALTARSVVKSGEVVVSVTAIANKIWSRYLEDETHLFADPVSIFERTVDLLTSLESDTKIAKNESAGLRARLNKSESENERLKRKLNSLEALMEKRARLYGERTPTVETGPFLTPSVPAQSTIASVRSPVRPPQDSPVRVGRSPAVRFKSRLGNDRPS